MKLAQIRHLVAVAELGSLPASAQALGVSRNALIRSIQALERELGTALLKRGKGSATLTPVGEIFARRAAAAQLELDRARREIDPGAGACGGLVSIGMSTSEHVSLLPRVLMPFRTRFEDVRLRIVEGEFAQVERDVRKGVLDFYVGPVRSHSQVAGLKTDKLHDTAGIVVGRKGHPRANATALAELADARWIAPSTLDLDALFERQDLPRPIVVVEAETGLGMLSAASACDALLLLPASWTPVIERTDLFDVLNLNEILAGPSIYLVTQARPPATPAAAHLIDLIVEASRADATVPRDIGSRVASAVPASGVDRSRRRDHATGSPRTGSDTHDRGI